MILGSLKSAGKPLTAAELKRCCGPEADGASCDSAIRDLMRAGKLHSWSTRRLWVEDEMSVLDREARKLIQNKPLWKSRLSKRLATTRWGSPQSKRDAVFERLKGSPGIHLWPQHGSLPGDSLCLREIELPFYLGKLQKEYERMAGKLLLAGVAPEAIAEAVCRKGSARGPAPAKDGATRRSPMPAAVLRDETGEDFQRDLCEQLAFAWRESGSCETRRSLEQAMFNCGLRQFGNPGEEVEFDGLAHEAAGLLLPGEKALIETPGWKLDRRGLCRVLIKAKVKN